MLKFDHVSKIYKKGKRAVDDLTFEIEQGEFIVLIGPSGCGKTTTMKMINRLIEPTEGNIYLNGENILDIDPVKLRRKIGYVIQQIGLFPHMTIEQNISLVPRLLKWPEEKRRERAKSLLTLVDMTPDFLDRFPFELSGGQQQRIGVLRALAADQPLILMDEPFGALDPITRDSLQSEFKKLQQKLGKTIVFVTHDMDEALKLADRIAIMKEGRLIQFDTPDEILRNPANTFVEEFIGKERLAQARPHIQTVDQIMNQAPVAVNGDVSLTDAIKIMKNRRVDTLLVIDEERKLEGYIDVENIDINRKKAKVVSEIVQRDIYAVKTGTLVRDTIRKFLNKGIKYVPVVDDEHHLVGIVTRANLVDVVYDSIWGEGNGVENGVHS
ncbi:betaine/proline/choline family ABC transporter ATP-binding protein [Fervidibacillus halotolerans]|uniref:Quaternary amine transport ATP-binding protein n=1 Tax=Fervidibacillus halotolerans TaxID=2980027 RepID=A0A9E8M0U9_9BACI|nr:betaine/proline/choline family ABC transporter ATP-binding protein [Fervidibacillus halotolerans]WAA12907.1 betaine/proline/choline family ABC transporter ATP-binding protein [Fervidibacillus halotolerans]